MSLLVEVHELIVPKLAHQSSKLFPIVQIFEAPELAPLVIFALGFFAVSLSVDLKGEVPLMTFLKPLWSFEFVDFIFFNQLVSNR